MALNKKKGSFTADPQVGEVRTSGRTAGGGANSVRIILLDGTALTIVSVDVSYRIRVGYGSGVTYVFIATLRRIIPASVSLHM